MNKFHLIVSGMISDLWQRCKMHSCHLHSKFCKTHFYLGFIPNFKMYCLLCWLLKSIIPISYLPLLEWQTELECCLQASSLLVLLFTNLSFQLPFKTSNLLCNRVERLKLMKVQTPVSQELKRRMSIIPCTAFASNPTLQRLYYTLSNFYLLIENNAITIAVFFPHKYTFFRGNIANIVMGVLMGLLVVATKQQQSSGMSYKKIACKLTQRRI